MPIYEYECEECGERFEELVGTERRCAALPALRRRGGRRLISRVSPLGRQPRGAAVRSDESRRGERESVHKEQLGERDRPKRAKEVKKQ